MKYANMAVLVRRQSNVEAPVWYYEGRCAVVFIWLLYFEVPVQIFVR